MKVSDTMRSNVKNLMSTATRDAAIAIVAVFLISALSGYVVFQSASEGLKKEVQSNLLNIARSASHLLDGDTHQQLSRPEDKGSEAYERARAPFFKLLRANPNIAFIYTVIEKDGKNYFILDSKIIKPGEKDDTSAVMEEYTDATGTMKQALATRSALVEDQAYTDEWGTFLSAYAPIYDSRGTYLGIVGADIRLTDYLMRLDNIRKALILGLTVSLVAAVIWGVCVWFGRTAALKSERKNKDQQAQMIAMEQTRTEEQQREKAEAEKKKHAELQELAETFEFSVKGMVSQVASAASQMQTGAADVTRIAADTKERSGRVASLSSEAAQSSSQVAAAAEELSASIREIRTQTQKSSQIAVTASNKAEAAKIYIQSLAEKSSKVNEIISVITSIAGQINLLALNATIESARAGEAGKGFAVVAGEVKNLAGQVAKATDEITSQIHAMQEATHLSVDSVMEIIRIIADVSQSTGTVASAVEEQSTVTNEIARNIAQTSTGTQDISDNIGSVQEGAERTGETAQRVLSSAENLSRQSSVLSQKVEEFLSSIRAA